MSQSEKYGRSLHAQISLGTTSDDRFMPDGYVKAFADMDNLVMTEKLDGQNNCFNKYGVFARSHVGITAHPWDKPMRERWELIKNDLGRIELFGENMYGVHSIGYKNLESYYYMFGARELDHWMSWEEVKFYAEMFDFPTVPEIPIKVSLKEFYENKEDNVNLRRISENDVLADWLDVNLGMTWEQSVDTPGMLGGYDPTTGLPASEGFVIRNADGYVKNDGIISVADNEFNNLFKLVRKGHVKTDEHWTKNWKAAELIDYQKYKWYAYEYLKHK
jgi:hypothetical protein